MLSQKQRRALEKMRDEAYLQAQTDGPYQQHRKHIAKALSMALTEPYTSTYGPAYIRKAKSDHHVDGHLEIDDDAVVSESEEGAYVQAWVWVPKEAI